MLLGRLAIHLDAEDLLLLKPSIITKLFVVSVRIYSISFLC